MRELHEDPANVRLHNERSIRAIAASLARFGQQKPIVIDARGVVIAGSGTLRAASELGWSHVAAVRSDLLDADRTAYAIADNRTAELSSWDQKALGSILGTLEPGVAEGLGFDADELSALVAASGGQQVSQDEPPAVAAKAVSRPGDLWILGRHRLLCGDCTKPEDVARVMGSHKAVLFATDPPYLVGYDGMNHPQSFGSNKNKDWSASYGATWDDADANSDLYDRFLEAAAPHLHDRAAWYCWHASRRQAMLEQAWEKRGAFVHAQIIWAKDRPILTRSWYLWQHEPCFMGWKRKQKPARSPSAGSGRPATVWNIPTIPNGDDRPDHPTPKPVEIFAIPMREHTREGDVCYEPFSGSGTQIVAAEQLRRRCFAIDIQPLYIDVAVRRWQALTGATAMLEGTKQTFAQVESRRAREKPKPAAEPGRESRPARATSRRSA